MALTMTPTYMASLPTRTNVSHQYALRTAQITINNTYVRLTSFLMSTFVVDSTPLYLEIQVDGDPPPARFPNIESLVLNGVFTFFLLLSEGAGVAFSLPPSAVLLSLLRFPELQNACYNVATQTYDTQCNASHHNHTWEAPASWSSLRGLCSCSPRRLIGEFSLRSKHLWLPTTSQ